MERWSIPIALFILLIAWWIFATAMHRWNGWRDTAHEMRADRDQWRREAIIEHRKVVYLSGILHQKDIRTREYGFTNPHWTKAAADAVQEATDER